MFSAFPPDFQNQRNHVCSVFPDTMQNKSIIKIPWSAHPRTQPQLAPSEPSQWNHWLIKAIDSVILWWATQTDQEDYRHPVNQQGGKTGCAVPSTTPITPPPKKKSNNTPPPSTPHTWRRAPASCQRSLGGRGSAATGTGVSGIPGMAQPPCSSGPGCAASQHPVPLLNGEAYLSALHTQLQLKITEMSEVCSSHPVHLWVWSSQGRKGLRAVCVLATIFLHYQCTLQFRQMYSISDLTEVIRASWRILPNWFCA